MYHRIAEVAIDPWGLCVSPRRFSEQLETLTRHGALARLSELSAALNDPPGGRPAVALTFDDGYADNLYTALPILQQYGAPATFFLTSGAMGCPSGYWWDELESLLLQPGELPAELTVEIAGQVHHWVLGDMAHYTAEQSREYVAWRVGHSLPTPRHAAYLDLWQLLYALPHSEKRRILDQLAKQAQVALTHRSSHRCLTRDEIAELAEHDTMDIGSHSVTHAPLPRLPAAAQLAEIEQSRNDLIAWVGRPVESFAYPHGDVAKQTADLVRQAGFGQACTTAARVLGPNTDRFQLPRMQVLDWDGDDFGTRLASWGKTAA